MHPSLDLPVVLIDLLFEAAAIAERNARQKRRIAARARNPGESRRGDTLRPGTGTPLWNQLAEALRPHLRKHGSRANLARELRLPRQRVTEFLRSKRTMPDAERTLQLMGWLAVQLRIEGASAKKT